MANLKSSQKDVRRIAKRRVRNVHVRSTVKTAVKKVTDALAAKDPAKARDALKAAEKTLKKAASKGVIAKGNADRHVSRLAKAVGALK